MDGKLDMVSIVLLRPRVPENIGAAARVACNFGISSLILVHDERPDQKRMEKTATHNTAHILKTMPCVTHLDEALQDFQLVVGTTARRGKQRFAERDPKQVTRWLAPRLHKNRTALLFGPEDTGLSNEDLKYCQMVSSIPTDTFSSLNLAQAIAIHCYELHHELIYRPKTLNHVPKLASSHELESMYSYIEDALTEIHFLDEEGRPRWMANIRNFLGRMELEARDANLIRSICKKFLQFQGLPLIRRKP